MKKKFLCTVSLVMLMVSLAFTGCSNSAPREHDAETEAKLIGKWEWSATQMEDGELGAFHTTEEYCEDMTYSFVTKCKSDGIWLFTVTGSGTWSASKDFITVEYDKKSIEFKVNTSFFDQSDRKELEENFVEELRKEDYIDNTPINSEITDSFESEDEEFGAITYYRIK
ncbi:MAG: hypothetical protein HDS52_07565 [Barnesiella sp.]|nr:hypothetical protein [Barnesiella sp.]